MRLGHYFFDSPIDFDTDCVQNLIIEDQKTLSEFIFEMISQIEGETGNFVLIENASELDLTKRLQILLDPFRIDLNFRANISALYSELSREAHGEKNLVETTRLLNSICQHISDLISEQDVSVSISKEANILDILKMLGVGFEKDEEGGILTRLSQYISTCSKYADIKVFVFINLRRFMSEKEIDMFCEFALYNKIPILLVENINPNIPSKYPTKIIDSDLCEINH